MQKILVIAPSWVGDLVMAQGLFKLLKQRYQSILIHVLADQLLMPLLQYMPEVDKVIAVNFGSGQLNLLQRYFMAKSLQLEQYSQAVVLPNSFKSALIPFFAKIPVRIGWRGEWRYGLLTDIRVLYEEKYPLMVKRFLALGLTKNQTLPPLDQNILPSITITPAITNAALKQLKITELPGKPILAICPGAKYGPAKRWPAEYFADIAKQYFAKGWEIWLFGCESDRKIAKEVQKLTGNSCFDLVGKTDLRQATALLTLAQLVLTNDSGLMHIAAAIGRPVVALFGSTSPNFAPPLTSNKQIAYLHLSCSPCFARKCPLQHFKCMRELTPQMVGESLLKALTYEKNTVS